MREPATRRIRLRRAGWRRRASELGPVPVRAGSVVDIAVDARLFGRVPLLTIDATVDIVGVPEVEALEVAERTGSGELQLVTGTTHAHASGPGGELRRGTVEAVLREATESLGPGPR
ncbi:MAG TPA: hypothetical protein VKZ55_02445 [Microthrixaceae bacterium]|nr:hypothetical protein [Microthrixaceae bacterium]